MTSRFTRAILALALALFVGLMLAGGEAWAAAPPTLEVQTIGSGIVTASGISCGAGNLACSTAYANDPTSVTLTATPSAGWTFVRWDDDAGLVCATPTCTLSVTGDMYATAVFTTSAAVQVATVTAAVTQDSGVPEGNVTDTSADSTIDCPNNNCSAPR